MDVVDLAERLLSLEEKEELQNAVRLLEDRDLSAFYEKNRSIVRDMLFIEELDEFLDFSSKDLLDTECFCAAFMCAKGYGIQVGGYEDDLTQALTDFFKAKVPDQPAVFAVIGQEKIYTDCSGYDTFKRSLAAIDQIIAPYGERVIVLADSMYCDCLYTVLLLDAPLAEEVTTAWQSDTFEIYL